MKNQISKYILIFLIIVFSILFAILIYIRFFSTNKSKEYAILKEKGEGEIIYLDTLIVDMLNKLNNIDYSRYTVTVEEINEGEQQTSSKSSSSNGDTQSSNPESEKSVSSDSGSVSKEADQTQSRETKLSETNTLINSNSREIQWDKISYNVETLYTTWPTITIDLKSLNIPDEEISKFSNALDGVTQSIKNKDKSNSLINLYNLYAMLPRFLAYFTNDEAKINLYNTKAYVLNAYVSSEKDKWEEMNSNILQAINSLSMVLNSDSILESEKSSFDKAYILLQELQRSIILEDKEIFYLKYKLTIEQLEVL